MARARRGARDVLHGPAPEDALPRAASTVYFNLDDDVGVLAARPDRPDRLLEVRPQERGLRRTAKQNVDVFTYPLLDVLEPQMGDQLLEVLRKIDTRSSHQAIDVPKVFPDSAPLRRVESRPPQLAEQLVEVPPPNPGYALAVVASRAFFGARDSAALLLGFGEEGAVHVLDRIQQRIWCSSSGSAGRRWRCFKVLSQLVGLPPDHVISVVVGARCRPGLYWIVRYSWGEY